jgi:uncharacterized protein involved in response to NO
MASFFDAESALRLTMKRTAETQRPWTGRPCGAAAFVFFLGVALSAIAAIAIWPPFFTGEIAIPTAFSPVDWHVHDMIYGYGGAVMAVFCSRRSPTGQGGCSSRTASGPPSA